MDQRSTNDAPNPNPVANTPASTDSPAVAQNDMIKALDLLKAKVKAELGETLTNERISQLLFAHMDRFIQDGKLSKRQIMQLKEFANIHKAQTSDLESDPSLEAAFASISLNSESMV